MKGYRYVLNISPISKGYKCGNRFLFLEMQLLQQDMTHSWKKAIHSQALAYPFNSLSRLEPELHATNNTSSYLTFINAYFKTLYLAIRKNKKKSTWKIKNVSRACIYMCSIDGYARRKTKNSQISHLPAQKILLPNFYLICDYLVCCTECGRGLKKRCNTCSRWQMDAPPCGLRGNHWQGRKSW